MTIPTKTIENTLGRIEEKLDGITHRLSGTEENSRVMAATVSLLTTRVAVLEATNVAAKFEALNTKVTYGLGALAVLTFALNFFRAQLLGLVT